MPLIRLVCALLAGALAASAWAARPLALRNTSQGPALLGVDEAFQLLPAQRRGDRIHVEWNVQPGYFLYRDRLRFELLGARAGTPQLPAGEAHDDGEGGTVQVMRGIVATDLPLQGTVAGALRLRVRYQGCADAGVCYPPQEREVGVEAAK